MDGRQRFTRLELGVGLLVLLLGVGVSGGCRDRIAEKGQIVRGISNCRQIITALRIYSSDHGGKYPDASLKSKRTANAAFRLLFEEGAIDDEMIFGCPLSPFEPDGKIEDAYIGPEGGRFGKALQPDENHWAMTAGVSDSNSGGIPLVYENPMSATWPPKWNVDAAEKPVRGRAWKTGIIIGLNDSSVAIQPVASKSGKAVGLKPDPATGKDLFEAAIDPKDFPKGEILDIE